MQRFFFQSKKVSAHIFHLKHETCWMRHLTNTFGFMSKWWEHERKISIFNMYLSLFTFNTSCEMMATTIFVAVYQRITASILYYMVQFYLFSLYCILSLCLTWLWWVICLFCVVKCMSCWIAIATRNILFTLEWKPLDRF